MSVEFIGLISSKQRNEVRPVAGTADYRIDRDYLIRFARAHEEGGFDAVLLGYGSTGDDPFATAAVAAANTDSLRYLIAHRPGFVGPTLEARKVTTLDHLTGGRIVLNIITGGNNAEQRRDGDFLEKDDRYARTDEFLDVLKLAWTSPKPFDYNGRYYHVEGAYSDDKPLQQPYPPLYVSGASDAAVHVGARHADVYMMWGEPLADVAQRIRGIRAAAAAYGRSPRISVSVRPILGPTESAAWDRAHEILEGVLAERARRGLGEPARPENVGSQRLLAAAAAGDVADRRLYTAIARANGAQGNSTALVGTPEQVAEALLEYYDLGVDTILIRGFDPLEDAIAYGRDLIPLVRGEVARREAARNRTEPVPA